MIADPKMGRGKDPRYWQFNGNFRSQNTAAVFAKVMRVIAPPIGFKCVVKISKKLIQGILAHFGMKCETDWYICKMSFSSEQDAQHWKSQQRPI